jgi:hypothetical protein
MQSFDSSPDSWQKAHVVWAIGKTQTVNANAYGARTFYHDAEGQPAKRAGARMPAVHGVKGSILSKRRCLIKYSSKPC